MCPKGHKVLSGDIRDCKVSRCRQDSNFDQQPAPKGDDPVVMYPPSSYRYFGADTWSRFDACLAEKWSTPGAFTDCWAYAPTSQGTHSRLRRSRSDSESRSQFF